MKLAFSKPTDGEEEKSLLFNGFRPIGYEGLQLKTSQYASYLDQPERFVEEWGGIPGAAAALIALGNLDEQRAEDLRKVYRFGRIAGSELIVYCLTIARDSVTTEDIKKIARKASELGKEAEQNGLQLSIHNHVFSALMHRQDFEIFFDECSSAGLTLDTAHAARSGIADIAGVIHDFQRVIDNFHLKDLKGEEWVVLGHGEIDFAPIFKAIKQADRPAWVSADEESGMGMTEAMKECFAYMSNGFNKT